MTGGVVHDLTTREAVRRSLESTGLVVVAEAADGATAVRLVEEHRPDVVLVDLGAPRQRGPRAAEVRVLVLTVEGPAAAERAPTTVTAREQEILQLIADGCSTPEVAARLHISPKTVKNHLAAIYPKLDARDRTQAVLRAVRTGIIRLD